MAERTDRYYHTNHETRLQHRVTDLERKLADAGKVSRELTICQRDLRELKRKERTFQLFASQMPNPQQDNNRRPDEKGGGTSWDTAIHQQADSLTLC